jgi:hypothetical protein
MVAWVLNLDAEDELAAPGGSHTSSRAMRARMAAMVERIEGLVAAGDVVLRDGEDTRADGVPGDAWCPTPRALARLRRAGAILPPAPSVEILRAVNGRAFCAAMGQTLPGAAYVTRVERALELLERAHGPWLAKRPLGFAGRGRRRLRAAALTEDDRAWLTASIRDHGGLQMEPLVERVADFGIHGHVAESGALRVGAPTVQRCDGHGAWLSTALAAPSELVSEEERALLEEASRVADALYRAGYFGPFGVDAYRFRHARRDTRFNPRSEINARYSMGWAVGMRQKQT